MTRKIDYTPALLTQLRALNLPEPILEFRFVPLRRWRFDTCWPALKIAAEIEGGTWINGRHSRPQGYAADCEKYNMANLLGWHVYRFTKDMVLNGEAVTMLEKAIKEVK